MKEKKNLIIILILLIGVVGITLAYFSNTTSIDNLFSTKKYGSTITEEFISPDSWLPGDVTDKTVVATNTGEVDQAVRISYTEKWLDSNNNELKGWIHEDGSKSSHTTEEELSNDERVAIINFDNNDDWTYKDGYYYYNYRLQPNESTSSLIKSVTFNPKTKLDDTCTTTISDGKKTITCNSSGSDYDNAKYTLTFKIETVQFNKYMNAWNTDVAIASSKILFCDSLESGESVYYNGSKYYVLKDSSISDNYVTLLKKYPLTANDVNQYSTDYVSQDGEYPYYESDTCNGNTQTGCSTNYDTSSIKKIVDGWSDSFNDDLVNVDGYKVRFLTQSELVSKYGYSYVNSSPSDNGYRASSETPFWIYVKNKTTWSMTGYDDSNTSLYGVNYWLEEKKAYNKLYIRPIINIQKKNKDGECNIKNNNLEQQIPSCDINNYNHVGYSIGDIILYNDDSYYVIDNSNEEQNYVTLLKTDSLTYGELLTYGDDYEIKNYNDIGLMSYYKSDTCEYYGDSGCKKIYNESNVKNVVDNWSYKIDNNLVEINGYKARLITVEELKDNFDYEVILDTGGLRYLKSENTPSWIYESYNYWTMSPDHYFQNSVFCNTLHEDFVSKSVDQNYAVRPVINLKKCAISN